MRKFLIADLFAGAGGSSTGAEKAVRAIGGEMVLVAVNHWPVAIETHQKNHPNARHYCVDLDAARPEELVPEGRLDLLLASPECVFFSRARGGKPVSDQRRMSAWHVQRWCTALDVRCLLIENVPEFIDWGPLLPEGKPDPKRKGLYFQAWHRALRELGYDVDFCVLNAADHGDATTRRRFFLQARKDGRRISWPQPSHRKPGAKSGAMLADRRPTWRAAREVIDWANAGRSLLDDPKYRKRPLSEKTRRRIARGLAKFGGPLAPLYIALLGLDPEPAEATAPAAFMLPQRENNLPKSVDGPVPTIVTVARIGLVEPTLEPFVGANRNNNVPHAAGEPIPSPTTATGGGSYVVVPMTVPLILGQQSGAAARPASEPIPTVAAAGAISLTQAVLTQFNGKSDGAPVSSPLPTQTAKARFGLVESLAVPYGPRAEARSTDEPLPTILTRDRLGVVTGTVEPFVVSRHSNDLARSTDEPLPTATARGAGYLVEPFLLSKHGDFNGAGGVPARSVELPVYSPTTESAAKLVEPFMVPYRGEREGQEPRAHSVDEPAPTITAGAKGHGLVQPCIVKVTGGEKGSAPVIVQTDQTGGNGAYIRSVEDPLYTLTTKRNLGLAEPVLRKIEAGEINPRRVVLVDGEPHLLDIRFRMLTNRELARAMGFDDAEAEYEFVGTVEQVTRQIGNAVPVNLAKALVTAILDDRAHAQEGAA